MNRLLVVVFCLFILGCATVGRINRISVGMTKDRVIHALGQPVSTTAKDGVEYLNYRFVESGYDVMMSFDGGNVPYYVKIVNGKVSEYGREGKK